MSADDRVINIEDALHDIKPILRYTCCFQAGYEKAIKWMDDQDKKYIEKQLNDSSLDNRIKENIKNNNRPYYGICSDGYTIMITPSTIGASIYLKNNYTGEILDVFEDYEF